MSWITVIWAMGASACLTLAAMYFSVWVRNRARAHLLFAMTAASFAVYAFFELRILLAQTPEELDAALRWAQVPLSIGLVSLTWFVSGYLNAGRRWLVWAIGGLRVLYVMPSLVFGGNPSVLGVASLEHLQLLGQSITIPRGTPNPWGLIGLLTVLLILVFVGDASLTAWRRGDRRKALMVGISVGFILSAGFLMSALLLWAGFRVPVANSLYYQALMVMMGYELSRDLFRASQLAHDLRASEARSQAILRAVPDLMFLQSMDGVYLDFHASRPDHLLMPPESFLGKNMRDVLPPEVLRAVAPAFSEAVTAAEPVMIEYELPMPHGQRRYEARLVRNDGDQILTVVRDVTERRRVEDALRESQQRYTLAAAAGAVGVWDWNFETNELFVDPGLKSILGFDDREISTRPDDWGSRVHSEDLPVAAAGVKNCVDGITDSYEIEHRMLHKDGSVKWMLSRGSALRAPDGSLRRLVGTKVDITQRKLAEDAIRESQAVLKASHREINDLAGRLIASQEVERARIARDLHDDLSQEIAGLSIALSAIKRQVTGMPDGAVLARDVSAVQQRAIALAENVRDLSHDLHPSVLEHSGLITALTTHCAEIERNQRMAVTFSADGDFASTSADTALCLYRVAQEGLRNVVTHAKARRAEVRLFRAGDFAELSIADDGRGFDIVGGGRNGHGLGLVSISERVRLVGGTVSIVSELNKGTRLRVQVPANGHAAHALPN